MGKKKVDWNVIIDGFNKVGYILLCDEVEYINAKTKLKCACAKHPNKIQFKTWSDIKQGKGCKFCRNENTSKNNRKYTIEFIEQEFKKRNYLLITKEYFSTEQKLEYICLEHPEEIRNITLNKFLKKQGCKNCGYKRISENKKLDYEFVKTEFDKRNYDLLEDEYIHSKEEMKFRCRKHPETTQKISYNHLSIGCGCKFCRQENRFGETSSNWKGGITPLSNHLRGVIESWKEDSLLFGEYKCNISLINHNKLIVHHIYSFSDIVKETLETLGLTARPVISDYSNEELRKIEEKCLDLHYEYGFGVLLIPELHHEFHGIYSRYEFTPEQFYEFKEMKQQELANLSNNDLNSDKEVYNDCTI